MFKQIKLRQQARIDYQQARGTAHKNILRTAFHNFEGQQKTCQQTIQNANKEIRRFQAQQHKALEKSLTDYLVEERLREVSGIGAVRQADILRLVYKGKLTDLYDAHQLPGIGEQTQISLNQWIQAYQNKFSDLLQEDFPGKRVINQSYQALIQGQKATIVEMEKKIQALQTKLDRIQMELEWLDSVSVQDFLRALNNPRQAKDDLDRYLQGVFAEWEPVPDWFRALLAVDPGLSQTGQLEGKDSAKVTDIVGDTLLIWGNKREQRQLLVIAAIILCFGCLYLSVSVLDNDNETAPVVMPTRTETAVPSATATLPPRATATLVSTATTRPSRTPGATPTTVMTKTEAPQATALATPRIQVRVSVRAANVRAEPNTTAVVVGTARGEEVLLVLDVNEAESWFLVELPDGSQGWIGSSVVTVLEGTEPP